MTARGTQRLFHLQIDDRPSSRRDLASFLSLLSSLSIVTVDALLTTGHCDS